MKSIPQGGTSSMILMNRRRAESGEKHKPRTSKTEVLATCCNEIGESRRVNAGSLAETPDDATLIKAARGAPACAS